MNDDEDLTYEKLNEGLALYNAGHRFEAHELWEDAWRDEVGRSKLTLQALIQLAAGLYKHDTGNPVGTCKLLAKALDKVQEIREGASAWLGIDLVRLEADIARALAAADTIATGGTAEVVAPTLPDRSGRDGVLYLHGFASSPQSKKAATIVPALRARGLHVAVPDLNEDDFEHLTVSRALALAKRHVRERTLVIGSSFGGYLASLLAARDDRVKGLVLMAPAFDFSERFEARYGGHAVRMWEERGFVEVEHYGLEGMQRLSFDLLRDARTHPSRPPLRVPTYVLQGRGDDIVDPAMVEAVVAANEKATLDLVDDEHGLTASVDRALAAAMGTVERLGLEPDPVARDVATILAELD